ncbi:MAG: ATP-binding protein [Chromatiales bacterium]|jgi:hypothetical protein
MTDIQTLAPEWERIDLLGACLSMHRSGKAIGRDTTERLTALQQEIAGLRRQPPWQPLSHHWELTALDQDILACALAPEVEPRLGWMYQELQAGLAVAYPTPALLRELLFLDPSDIPPFQNRLLSDAPLFRWGLLEAVPRDSYQPIRPTRRALAALLGWQELPHPLPGAIPMTARGTWNELVLPPRCRKDLREYLLWVSHRSRVIVEWGARGGGGPVALFAGPSGTGKTFAAEVIANTLGWPLYRIDLGLLVSKYVGETEENLNALFDAAHGQAMVLLFDEADSLFGKRGDIREARDRYANMEVSHLLSRIERHEGPCILTSNLREHLDPAFARRFQTVIEFPRPDAAARLRLWQIHLPPRAPIDGDLDLGLVADSVVLTGGQIRNAALHAAYLAAGEDVAISLAHITSAIWSELAKPGREVTPSSLGGLAVHLKEEAA